MYDLKVKHHQELLKKMKICLINNYAQHYRASIFKLNSETFDTDFYFGDYMADVKKMDCNKLNGKVKEVHTKRICNFTFQSGTY